MPDPAGSTLKEARSELAEYAALTFQRGLTFGSGGNISMRWQEGLLISASGASLRELAPEQILFVSPGAPPPESGPRPSIETAFHAAIYAARPDINAVLHVHSRYATLYAIKGRPIPLHAAADKILLGPIPLIAAAEPGSPQLVRLIEKQLAEDKECKALLLTGHGAIAMGEDMEAAFNIADMLEEAAYRGWLLETDR